MSNEYPSGRILSGDKKEIEAAILRFKDQPADETIINNGPYPFSLKRTTLAGSASATGPGTFFGKMQRTLTFSAAAVPGWWIRRTDQKEQLDTEVSVRNVWTTARNIVLRSGSAHNYLRMVEHIIALKTGLGLDDVIISTDNGDPPLFNRGNLDLVEAVERAKIIEKDEPAKFVTVREPVTLSAGRGDFLTYIPAEPGNPGLRVDCAVDFPSVIGKQRIIFDVTPDTFRIGAGARTNAPFKDYLFAKTAGKFIADTRNLGYTRDNILIHGKKKYFSEPKIIRNGKSLEAVWHRATLDLLAAVSLIDRGRFAGTIVSYRSGHTQVCGSELRHSHA